MCRPLLFVDHTQGTLREALDAALLVNKTTGQHDVPIVLSLAHNVACAMAYLHQVRFLCVSPCVCASHLVRWCSTCDRCAGWHSVRPLS